MLAAGPMSTLMVIGTLARVMARLNVKLTCVEVAVTAVFKRAQVLVAFRLLDVVMLLFVEVPKFGWRDDEVVLTDELRLSRCR